LRLAANRFIDRAGDGLVPFGRAQRRAEVGGVFLTKAHVEGAGAGETNAVAAFAEIVRHWGDEAETPARFLDLDVAGRAASLVGNVGKRELTLKVGAQLR